MKRYFLHTILFTLVFVLIHCTKARGGNYTYNSLKFFNHDLVAQPAPYGCSNMYKDYYGFLWISTINGVSIYDGNSFTHVPAYAEKENYFLGNSPHTFLQLDKTRMLIACTNGLYIFSYYTRQVNKVNTAFPIDRGDKVGIVASDSVAKRIAVKVGNVAYVYDYNLHQVKRVVCADEDEGVTVKQKETGSSIFYCTHSGILMSMDIHTGRCDTLMAVADTRRGIAINEERRGLYMVMTASALTVLDAYSKKQTLNLKLPLKNDITFKPECATMDTEGNFWIGGHNKLFIYFPKTGKIIPARRVDNETGYTQEVNQMVTDIVIDKDGTFISTGDEGLLVLEKNPVSITDYPLKGSISSLYIRGNNLYCSSADGGITRFTIGDTKHRYFYPPTGHYGVIQYMEALDRDHIWVQFKNDLRISILNLDNMKLLTAPLPFDSMIRAFAKKTGYLYSYASVRPIITKAGTDRYYLSIGADLFTVTGSVRSGFRLVHTGAVSSKSVISYILYTAPDHVLIATNKLELYTLINGRLREGYRPPKPYSIPIWGLDTDPEGNIYAGTPLGLYIFDNNLRLKQHLDEDNTRMLDSWINSLALDKSGVAWLSSLGGLMAYNTNTNQLLDFPSGRFIRSPRFWIKSMAKDSAGNIFFGGSDGVVMLPASSPSLKPRHVRLYFDEIVNSGKVLYSGIIPQSLTTARAFKYNHNTFTFVIHGIYFQQTTSLDYKYKYRLEGYDADWHLPRGDNRINYMNLPAGKYTLVVRELNPLPGSKANQILYTFSIAKPFWKTTAFIILMVLAGSALVAFIVVFINRRQMEQERIRTSRLMALKAERERISQELHDDLGSGLTSIKLLTKAIVSKKGTGNFLDMMNVVGEISDELIDQMSEIIWVLNNIDETFDGLLVHLRNYMAAYLERVSLNIKLQFTNNITGKYTLNGTVRRTLLLAVKEVFHNVIKHSCATTLSVNCSEQDDMVVLKITDNGVGFPQTALTKGNGIANIKMRIETLSGHVEFDSNNGTTVTISIPKNNLTI